MGLAPDEFKFREEADRTRRQRWKNRKLTLFRPGVNLTTVWLIVHRDMYFTTSEEVQPRAKVSVSQNDCRRQEHMVNGLSSFPTSQLQKVYAAFTRGRHSLRELGLSVCAIDVDWTNRTTDLLKDDPLHLYATAAPANT